MVFIETSVFTRSIKQLMSDDEYQDMQEALIFNPELGVLIQGTGGLRKLRWKQENRGKSGGVRTIYYWATTKQQMYMLFAYSKNAQEELRADQKKALKSIVERWEHE